MNTTKVKIGSKVIANRTIGYGGNDNIEKGNTYTVSNISGDYIYSKECPYAYPLSFFNLAPKRDARGRFVSTKVTVTPKAKNIIAPTVLKRGSLYGVKRKKGRIVARLRSTAAVGDIVYGVFTRHKGKPFLIKKPQVSLADTEEVQSYLKGQ